MYLYKFISLFLARRNLNSYLSIKLTSVFVCTCLYVCVVVCMEPRGPKILKDNISIDKTFSHYFILFLLDTTAIRFLALERAKKKDEASIIPLFLYSE